MSAKIVPFSRWEGHLAAFLAACRYRPGPAAERRFTVDYALAGELEREIVERVEHQHRPWTLAGMDAGRDVFTSLDNYFRPCQERYADEQAREARLASERWARDRQIEEELARSLVEQERHRWGLPEPEPGGRAFSLRR